MLVFKSSENVFILLIYIWAIFLERPSLAAAWSIPFVKNSKTVPSVKVVLEPPEDPFPQISALIQVLEKQRIRYAVHIECILLATNHSRIIFIFSAQKGQ